MKTIKTEKRLALRTMRASSAQVVMDRMAHDSIVRAKLCEQLEIAINFLNALDDNGMDLYVKRMRDAIAYANERR